MLDFTATYRTVSRFSPHIEIRSPTERTQANRFTLYDTERDLYFVLGEAELYVARLFNGNRSHDEILELMSAEKGKAVSREKLVHFEKRLLSLGILCTGDNKLSKHRDPFVGITYGPLKALLMIPLFRIQPKGLLEWLASSMPILLQRRFVFLCLTIVIGALAIVLTHWTSFQKDMGLVYGGWMWLLLHYPILIVSVAVHELGHSLACHAYRVQVRELGLAIYLLLVTGWARPVQSQWNGLNKSQRIFTILMGPFASLVFSAIGVFIWLVAIPQSYMASIGLVMAVTSTLALIPTLLPIFNGDGYLALTEYLEIPGIRQKALSFVGSSLFGRIHSTAMVSQPTQILYYAIAIGIVLSWAIAWVLLFNLGSALYKAIFVS